MKSRSTPGYLQLQAQYIVELEMRIRGRLCLGGLDIVIH